MNLHSLMRAGFVLVVCLVLAACTSSRYSMKHDAAPVGDFDFSGVPDAKPVWEPISPRGNKSPYTVRGKQYQVLPSAQGYKETGISSWYGLKFHGELTSNGERYNMYEMSAAHKSLPIPSYLRVTNVANGKSVVVRVNDRGPFHQDRIIDLSFAAANRLGFANQGTAKVELEAITPAPMSTSAANDASISKSSVALDRLAPFIQVAAFSQRLAAEQTQQQLASVVSSHPIFIANPAAGAKRVYRVRVGPFASEQEAQLVRKRIESARIGSPMVISRSVRARDS